MKLVIKSEMVRAMLRNPYAMLCIRNNNQPYLAHVPLRGDVGYPIGELEAMLGKPLAEACNSRGELELILDLGDENG